MEAMAVEPPSLQLSWLSSSHLISNIKNAAVAHGPANLDHATLAAGLVMTFVVTLMLPCVALEYGHSRCAPSTRACATSGSMPGRLTLRRACSRYPPPVVPRSTSVSMESSAGNLTFFLAATIFSADRKQADQPTANNCSGLVPVPGVPGIESLTSRRPSEVRDDPPSRPPVVWAFAV